jgi:hypothetical protein
MGMGIFGRTVTQETQAVQHNHAGAIATFSFWKEILNPTHLILDIGLGEFIHFGSSGIFRRLRFSFSDDNRELARLHPFVLDFTKI